MTDETLIRKASDRELADKVCAITKLVRPDGGLYSFGTDEDLYTATMIVNDWRVAGVCLESWPTTINTEHLNITLDEMLRDPRAIIDAHPMPVSGVLSDE